MLVSVLLAFVTCQLGAATLPYMQIEYGDPTTYRFGYDIGNAPGAPRLLREEMKQPDGSIIGRYGYTDPYGNFREVRYVAGEKGFVITQDKTVPDAEKVVVPPDSQPQAPSAEIKEQAAKRPIYSSQEHLAEKAIPDELLSSGLPFASHFTEEGLFPRPPFYQLPGLSRKPDSSESFISSGLPFASFHPSELSDHHSLYEPKDRPSPEPNHPRRTTQRPRPSTAKTSPPRSPTTTHKLVTRPRPTSAPSTLPPPEPTPKVVLTNGAVEYHPYDYLSGKPALPQAFLSSGLPFASSLDQVKSGHLRPPVDHEHHKEGSLLYHKNGQKETPESLLASSLPFASFKDHPKAGGDSADVEQQQQPVPEKKTQPESFIQPFDPVSGKAVIPESFLASGLPFASAVSGKKQPPEAPLYHASDHLAQKQVLPTELLASGLPLASFRPSTEQSSSEPSDASKPDPYKSHGQVVDPVHGQVEIPESYLASGLPFASSPSGGAQRSYDLSSSGLPFFNLQDRYSHQSEIPGSYLSSGLPFASFRPGGGRAGDPSRSPGPVQLGGEGAALPEELLASGLPFASSFSKVSEASSSSSGSLGRTDPGKGQRTRVYESSHPFSSYQRPSHSILPAKPYGFNQRYSAPQRRIAFMYQGDDSSQIQDNSQGKTPKSTTPGASFVSIVENHQKDQAIGSQTSSDPAQPLKTENPSV